MSEAITDINLQNRTIVAPDRILVAQALADTGATTSGEFLFAQTLGAAEIKVAANGAVTTGVGETLVVTIVTADVTGGTFNNTLFTFTLPASTTIADGVEICAYVAPADVEECITKVIVTSDFDAQALAVDAYVTMV